MADDINNLILNIKGRDELAAITKEYKYTEEVLKDLIATKGKDDAATQAQAAAMVKLQKEINETTKAIKATEGATKDYGRGIQQSAWVIQDFTSANGDLGRALYAVQNNIPGLLQSFGLGTGLAGSISIV